LSAFSTGKGAPLLKSFSRVCITQSSNANSQFTPPIKNRDVHGTRINRKGWRMTKQEERRAQEREEITARIATFKATQEKFAREREEYFVTTMQNARKTERPSFWS
jgi:hypothetical protein